MSGCSTNFSPISLETPISEMFPDGIFAVALTYPLAQAINFLSQKIGVFWAVSIVTIILNAVIIALTFRSNVSMQRMQEIQPEVQKIQLKYEGRYGEGSQQRMNVELQNLYKKYDINPLGSLIATFIQFPVLISMYAAVRRSAAVANGTFLGQSLALTPKEAFAQGAFIIVAIYVAMIVMQFVSISMPRWLSIRKGKMEADRHHKTYEKPAQQNSFMMYGMIVFIGVIMLSWPAALSLYYCIYSVVNIGKTLLIDNMMHKEA
ncbi:MAG: YidC/Oxa1 family membrane protein insertase [Erysipelotrichaceae bacterium]|nr:YidC/Oxa1 family membrane protein insertase [Erysipelotrichaceae bacterium]